MSQKHILVVDDEAPMQRILEIILKSMGHTVTCAGNGREALERLQEQPADLVLTDLRMPEMDGLTLLRHLRAEGMEMPVILITAYGTVETAVDAMKEGACDFIIRPFENKAVELAVSRALELSQIRSQNRYLRQQLEAGWYDFIGNSSAMQAVYEAIERVAPTHASVLISGETGTGKELAARAVHRASEREGLFVPINCAAIPAEMLESELFGYVRGAFTGAAKDRTGKFELADGGTLFLDEITEMPMELQTKLLRVLQESAIERLGSNRTIDIDFRLIAATNRDPLKAVADKQLREDLYYRLNVFNLDLPPLRERDDDILLLARHFLVDKAAKLAQPVPHLPVEAESQLKNYGWPGNVRELENIMERALVLSNQGRIDPRDLPGADCSKAVVAESDDNKAPQVAEIEALQPQLDALESTLIAEALARNGNSKAKAARALEISERSLWYKIKKHGLG